MMPMTCRSLGIVTPRWPASIDNLKLQPVQPLSWTRQRCWSCTLHCDHHTTGQAGTRQPETLMQIPASTSGRAWHATTQESCHCECVVGVDSLVLWWLTDLLRHTTAISPTFVFSMPSLLASTSWSTSSHCKLWWGGCGRFADHSPAFHTEH